MAKVICAWCGEIKGEFSGEHDSHGMCTSCAEEMRNDIEKPESKIQSWDELVADVNRRIASGFYDSDIVNNQVANKIMQEAK